MRVRISWTALALLVLAGCSTKYAAVTPELQAGFLADLQAGKPNLDCGEGCALTWGQRASTIHAVDQAERWQELATDVMQIGFGNDLAYYYLGQAAQGLGYHQAAIAYYSRSLALATGQNPLVKCSAGTIGAQNDPCQGVNLVSDIPVLIQASRDAMAQQEQAAQAAQAASPPVHHHHHHVPAGTAAPSTTPAQPADAAASPAAQPPAATTAAPAPAPAPAAPGLLLPPPPTQ